MIQQRVIAEYESELERAQQPGYVSRYDESYESEDVVSEPEETPPKRGGERSHIQPAEVEPRAPHRPPSRSPASKPPREQRGGEFGAGIFE